MSEKAKKNCKGVISIFLIIIFISCYVLTGLLVDGGRYRLAMTMAESALDTASNSILSRYNKLVYDLYGLLATDSVKEEDLTSLFTHYVDDTLQLSDIDYSNLSTILGDAIVGAANGEQDAFVDLYDFEAEITSGSSVTLATTENVEYQILEHMKYRAPIQVMKGADGFLNNIASLLTVKDRLQAAKEKVGVTKEYESKDLFAHCSELIEKINQFNEGLLAFSIEPDGQKQSMEGVADTGHAKDCMDYIRQFDSRAGDISRQEKQKLEERLQEELEKKKKEKEKEKSNNKGNSNTNSKTEEEEESSDEEEVTLTEEEIQRIKSEVWTEFWPQYQEAEDALLTKYQNMTQQASAFYNTANRLRNEIESIYQEYEKYITALENKMKEHGDNEDYKTVFEPEIELAKANCGEVLKNLDIILSSRKYTREIGEDTLADETVSSYLASAASQIVANLRNQTGYSSLESAVRTEQGSTTMFGQIGEYSLGVVNPNLNSLYDMCHYFYTGHTQEVDVRNVDAIKKEEKLEKEKKVKEKDELRNLDEGNLSVHFTPASETNLNTCQVNADFRDGDNKNIDVEQTMQSGLNLIQGIAEMLEGARDNLYVNEYVLITFPNVVHHYNMDEKAREKKEKEIVTHLLDKDYNTYNATQAEVEYIITGNPDTKASVVNIEARLLGIRTILNLVAIFTDTAKISQANTIAVAAGPFAPLASILLLTGWALAESAIDVSYLMNGEEVPVLKRSADWQISIEGVLKKVVKQFAEKAADYISDKCSQYLDKAEEKVNGVIYEVYKNGSDVGTSISTASSEMKVWIDAGNESGISEIQEANHELFAEFQSELNAAGNTLNDTFSDDAREQATVAVSKAFENTKKNVKNSINTKLNNMTDSMMDKFAEKLPIGQVVSGGSSKGESSIKFDYMDYMRVFLMFMNQTVKVQRIQQLIQANIRYGQGNTEFSLENCHTGVWADMKCSIKFLFMSEAVVPEALKQNGRLQFTVHSAKTY